MTPESDRPPPIRPKSALAFIASAVLLAGGLVVSTVAWYVTVQGTSGEARGGTARIALSSACDAQARPVIEARLADYGLPSTPAGEFTYEIGLPGLPDDLPHVPQALVAGGVLVVAVDGVAVPAEVSQVGVQLAFSGTPVTLLMLKQGLPRAGVTVAIDGAPVEIESINGQELQIAARAGQSTEALRLATDRAVAVRRPLPCPVTVTRAERLTSGAP